MLKIAMEKFSMGKFNTGKEFYSVAQFLETATAN